MQLRVARHTERLDEVVEFYRDGIGLTEVGGFRGHAGYDGGFLAVPGTGAHLALTAAARHGAPTSRLELTGGGEHGAPRPHPESLSVLYLADRAVVDRPLRRVAVEPIAPANP